MRTISAGLGMPALAPQAQDVIGKLGNDEGISVDGKTFDIARGTAKGDRQARRQGDRPRRDHLRAGDKL